MYQTLFGGVFYINLEHRTDRRQEIESELNKMEMLYERFNAISYNPPGIGCSLSHLNVLKIAKAKNLKNVLILEDDFEFLVDKTRFWDEINTFFNKNIDYDVLLLSYNLFNSRPFDSQLFRVLDSQTASGYLVNSKYYDTLIDNIERGVDLFKQTGQHWFYQNDQYWKILQPIGNWYGFNTRIGKQRKSFSDLGNCIVDYNC
jgi:glycosyl transferase family 25